ncbi:F-box/WD repeat-containing protein pof1-like [Xenia sp. Carnegie-2017]|uniref:F-box/WD repeat-containing protein pof1-like n=1 Tax=Xenia sp. Carnegie-2017 TaxID=2897299 RepID=UPI001F0457A6|nr:F-box/WD repeat-containing protein pof1-like [Xenia sp. Carnegie-2017]XP_046849918.1 F-box/WD repeat-containing protein pof1-like [Xenia sp. Carnegie-2017]
MAARDEIKISQKTSILPPIICAWNQKKKNSHLPHPVQNVEKIYDLKRFCKLLCEWYEVWRGWQKEVLLCTLTEKCSVNLLVLLSTILKPVFHREFLFRLSGQYTNFKRENSQKSTTKFRRPRTRGNNVEKDLINGKDFDKKQSCKANKKLFHDEFREITGCGVFQGTKDKKLCKKRPSFKSRRCGTPSNESIESVNSSFTDWRRQKLSNKLIDYQKMSDTKVSNPIFFNAFEESRLRHVHTGNVYKSGEKISRFFSATRYNCLSEMKAKLVGSESWQNQLDQKCFKHERWWSDDMNENFFVHAQGSNLWKQFTRKLCEVNKQMDEYSDHEKVNVISEVIKSSEPEQINFFTQCLIQRLKNHTDVTILPDQTLLQVFSNLDAETLCLLSMVSKRWRYLAEDDYLWKKKCLELGLSNGVKNIVSLIENFAENRSVDWKRAYKEVYQMLINERKMEKEKEMEESVSTSSDSQFDSESEEDDDYNNRTQASAAAEGMTTDIQLAYLDLSPKLDVVSSKCFDENEILIRGDLASVRENASSELQNKKQNVDQEEIAFDVRTNKVQPRNEIENFQNESHQMITLTVLDVKSVKRVRKLQGHLDGVYAVQFDRKRCLTGSADRLLRMWDVRSGRTISTMTGHLGGVRCALFDREKIISGSWDATVMIWDIIKFTCLAVLRGHQGCVSCLGCNKVYIVSGSHDMTARVWDGDTWECLHVLEGHLGEVTCLYLSEKLLLTGSTDKTIKLWNLQTGKCAKTLLGHNNAVLSVQGCRALVISGSSEGKIMFWNIRFGSPVAIIQAHDGPCNSIDIWGDHFLSGGGDALVKQWDIGTMTCLRTLQGHRGPVQSVKMNWNRIISSSEDGTVRIWDLEDHLHKFGEQHEEYVNSVLSFNILELEEDKS